VEIPGAALLPERSPYVVRDNPPLLQSALALVRDARLQQSRTPILLSQDFCYAPVIDNVLYHS